MPWFFWSRTASSNATSDPNIGWAEGQAPSTINDSARAMMSETAKYRDDIAGAIVTTGTSTAYAVTSYSNFNQTGAGLSKLDGQVIAFTPHATNGATVTLNVDSLGAKPLRSAPNTELLAGVLIQGTPYVAVYNNTDGAFYLQGFYGNPYNIPLAGGLDYWGSTAPNSAFAFPFGQAIDRTTYAGLFALIGTTYGAGNGSTTFNLPDCRGRVVASPDNMGGSDASRLTTGNLSGVRTTLGGAGGEPAHPLSAGEIPSITSSGSGAPLTINVTSSNWVASNSNDSTAISAQAGGSGLAVAAGSGGTISKIASVGSATGNIASTSTNTGGATHNNMQPTILANRILRII
jgi:microcystin-dependent protein